MRTRTALAGTLMSLALVGPLASRAEAAPVEVVRCPSASSAVVCELLDQAVASLAPLQTVVAPAGADLGLVSLPGLAARPEGVPAEVVLAQTTSLREQLAALPAPVRGTPALEELARTLDALAAALVEPVAGPVSPASPTHPTSAPAPSAPRSAPAAGSSFGGAASSSEASAPVDRPAVPGVPTGDSLTLAPLALPDFGFDQGFTAAPDALDAPAPSVRPAELALPTAADQLPEGSSATEVVATIAAVVLLVVAAVAVDLRKRTRTIPS